MADRFPLILNTSANQIQEIASGDTLDLTGNNISNAGVITATSFSGPIVAGAGTSNITAGIITAVTFKGDGDFFDIDVDGHTNLDNVNISGVSTFAGAIDLNSDIDVDGHTNLDNVSIAGVTSVASLTSGRVVTVGTAGKLQDSNNLTFDSSELTLSSRHLLLDTDGYRIKLGTANDFQLWHTGSVNKIQSFVGNIEYISPAGSGHSFQVNSQEKLSIASNGNVSISQDLDVDGHTNLDNVSVAGVTTFAGTVNTASIVSTGIDLNGDLDVDGHTNLDNVSIAGVTTFSGAVTTGDHVTLSGVNPRITFTDTNHNPDFELYGSAGNFKIWDSTNAIGRLVVNSDGHIDIPGNLDCGAGIDVTGNIIASGNVTAVDATFSGNISVGGTLTYEDVTNIDSVGVVTARTGLKVLAGGANVVGVVTATAGMFVPDNNQIQVGNAAGSADLKIYHNTTHSYLDNATGKLHIRNNTGTYHGNGIHIEALADEDSIICNPNGAVKLFYDDGPKFETTNTGISVTGNILQTGSLNVNDSQYLYIGNSGDLRMHHDQANTINYINSQNGNLRIQQGGLTIIQTVGQGPKLYYGGNEKLATTNTGVTVTGTVAATSYTGDGSNLTGISVGITTEQVTPSSNVATLNLAKDDHKIVASGTYTIDVSGGTEAGAHTLRIENSGVSNVGFSTYFKFPSGGTPSLPTASGAISLISFSVHKVGSVGIATVLLSGASVNYS